MELQSNKARSPANCEGNSCILPKNFIMHPFKKKNILFIIIFFKIMIDGRDKNAVDIYGGRLPMLVYMAREKRPQWPHNFKARAMNTLVNF